MPAHFEHYAGIEAGHAAPLAQHRRAGKKCPGAVANTAGGAGIGGIEEGLPDDRDGKFLMGIDRTRGIEK